MSIRFREVLPVGGKWNVLLSVLLPVILLSGLSLAFTTSSSDSMDCCGSDDLDCCGGEDNQIGQGCGDRVPLKKTANLRALQTISIKSGETDERCGYKVAWSYGWKDDNESKKRPPINIRYQDTKNNKMFLNWGKTDELRDNLWGSSFEAPIQQKSFTEAKVIYITVKAECGMDFTHLLDTVDINLSLTYYKLKE